MIKKILINFCTDALPILSSPWFWLCACCIAVVYNNSFPLWLVVLLWCHCFFGLIDNCDMFRGACGLESEYVTKYKCSLSAPIDTVSRRRKTYSLLKETAEMLGYPNCTIKFESEKKVNDCIFITWRIPNRNVYNALKKFFSDAESANIAL